MIKTGARLNRKISAIISSMEQPLGTHIGNSLEIIESIEFLKGNYNKDLYEVTLQIASKILILSDIAKDFDEAKNLIDEVITSNTALDKLKQIIEAQGGNPECINNYNLFNVGKNKIEITAQNDGFISKLDALAVAKACKLLGAGRDKKSDNIDFGAGCVLKKKTGDKVQKGEIILTLYYNDVKTEKLEEAKNSALKAFEYSNAKPKMEELIYV